MNGTIRIHVDLPIDAYKLLAKRTDSQVGRLLRTLATRAALNDTDEPSRPELAPPAALPSPLGSRDSKTRLYNRTEKRMTLIRQMLSQGYKVREIADHIGITVSAVHQYQRRLAHTPPTEQERVHGIPGLVAAGYTPDEIAQSLNLDAAVIVAYLVGSRQAS
jgi:DNA-binding NarL/FixJ family response regulator